MILLLRFLLHLGVPSTFIGGLAFLTTYGLGVLLGAASIPFAVVTGLVAGLGMFIIDSVTSLSYNTWKERCLKRIEDARKLYAAGAYTYQQALLQEYNASYDLFNGEPSLALKNDKERKLSAWYVKHVLPKIFVYLEMRHGYSRRSIDLWKSYVEQIRALDRSKGVGKFFRGERIATGLATEIIRKEIQQVGPLEPEESELVRNLQNAGVVKLSREEYQQYTRG